MPELKERLCGDSVSDWTVVVVHPPPPACVFCLQSHPDSSSLVLSEVYLLASFLNPAESTMKGTTLGLNLCKCSFLI